MLPGMTTPSPAADPTTRIAGWSLVVGAGLLATAASVIGLAILVSAALDGSGQSSGSLGAGMLLGGIVVGAVLAAIGFGRLGVAAVWKRALLGLLTSVTGTVAPWVAASVIGRLGS
jgi:hypothetical protein